MERVWRPPEGADRCLDMMFVDNDNVAFLVGLLAGTALGAGLAILFTPKSGAELRKDIREAAERSAEAFREARARHTGETPTTNEANVRAFGHPGAVEHGNRPRASVSCLR
jgi:hypothetical protein